MNEAQVFSIHLRAGASLRYRSDFFASLAEQRDRRFQVIIVDESSESRAPDPLMPLDVIHLRHAREMSYAKAHNQAIAFALQRWPRETWSERFVILTRAETAFHPGCLEALAQAFASDPACMILGPKMLLAEVSQILDQDTIEMQMTRQIYEVGYTCGKDRRLSFLRAGEEDIEDENQQAPREVFGCSEPCLAIRASALESLLESQDRWLDESLPRGQELIDLCWRAHVAGLPVAVLPSTCIWFIPSEKQDQLTTRRYFYLAGPIREKNDWLSLELLHLPWVLFGFIRSAFMLVTHPSRLRQRFREWYVWIRTPRPTPVQNRSRRVSVAEMRRWFVSR